MERLREFTDGDEVKKLVTLPIDIVAKSGIQVKRFIEQGSRLSDKVVTVQIKIVSQSGIQVR